MRFSTKDVKLPGGIALDKWEVLLGGAIACFVVGLASSTVRFLIWVGVGLLVIWIATVFLVNLGYLKAKSDPPPREGGGSAPGT